MPFTKDEFLQIFRAYNEAVWPAQLALVAIALLIVAAVVSRRISSTRPLLILLSILWLWTALAYHAAFFATINPAAKIFAAAFVVQALLLLLPTRELPLIEFAGARGVTGALFVTYGLVVYPLANVMAGHAYPVMPTFGAPCPVTIFTIGILTAMRPARPFLLLIPIAWSLLGAIAAMKFGMVEDFGLTLAGLWAAGIVIEAMVGRIRRSAAGVAEAH